MNLLLSNQECDRFAAWLEHEASVDNMLVEQMAKFGPRFALVIEKRKMEANALLIIARKLRSTVSGSIG